MKKGSKHTGCRLYETFGRHLAMPTFWKKNRLCQESL